MLGIEAPVSGSGSAGRRAAAVPAVAVAAPATTAPASVAIRGSAARGGQAQRQPPAPALPAVPNPNLKARAFLDGTDVCICVWTLGLRFADVGELVPSRRQGLLREAALCARQHQPVSAGWPTAYLEAAGHRQPTQPVIAVDSRSFRDPAHGVSCRHVGLHGAVMMGLVESRKQDFRDLFAQQVWGPLLEAVAAAPVNELAMVHVLSFCKSGRHRSVAVAALLYDAICQVAEWNMLLNRLSGNSWWQATCNNCIDCQDKNDPRKQQALAAALAAVRTAERRFDNRRLGAQ